LLPGHAQAPRIEADFLSVQDGLPASTITSLIQDHLGYIWIGTGYGLSRYDGYEFVNYPPDQDNKNGLHGVNIHFIHETKQGDLWLGSDRGLHYFDRGRESFENFSPDTSSWNVHAIFEDSRGLIWTVSGKDNYLHRWDPDTKTFHQFFLADQKTPVRVGKINAVNTCRAPILEDAAGTIWIGTIGQGLLYYDRQKEQFVAAPNTATNFPSDTIYSLLRHRQQLWLGTAKGLSRYNLDQQQIWPFPNGDPARGEEVIDLRQDRNGSIWIQQRFAITRVEPESEKSKIYLELPKLDIGRAANVSNRSFFVYLGEDAQAQPYWFHLLNHEQIYQYDLQKDSIVAYTIDFPEKNQYWSYGLWMSELLSGLVDHTGMLWLGFGEEMLKLKISQSRFNTHPLNYYDVGQELIDLDRWGNFWIANVNGGELFKFTPERNRLSRINDHLPQIFLDGHGPNFLIDRQDNLWWGQYPTTGLHRFPIEASSFVNLALGKPVKASSIEHRLMLLPEFAVDGDPKTRWGSDFNDTPEYLVLDLEQSQYIDHLVLNWNSAYANTYEVLLSDDGKNWRSAYRTTNGKGQIDELPIHRQSRFVKLVMADKNTAYGISLRELEVWGALPDVIPFHSKTNEQLGLPSGTNYDIFQDHNDQIWIATIKGLVTYEYGKNKFETIRPPDDSHFELYGAQFFEDRNERIWILRQGRIYYVSPGSRQAKTFIHRIEENNNPVSFGQLFEDRNGFLWFFDGADGLYRYFSREGTGKLYLPGQRIKVVFEDSKGRIWVGGNQGLFLLDNTNGAFRQYTETQGLSFRQVNAINEDKDGRLWVGTSDGLSRFNPELEQFESYSKADGLFGDKVNKLARDEQGRILAVGVGGFSFFDPGSFQIDSTRAKVVISGLKLRNRIAKPGEKNSPLNQSIENTRSIRLAHDQNVIALEFTSLHYERPEENQYQVLMEGLDTTWVDLGRQRSVNYFGLPPGDYTFKVKGSNADGVWTETPTTLDITILPPWWKTSWAYFLWTLLVSGGLYVLYKYSLHRHLAMEETRRMKELDHLKSRLYTNITHEFRTPLTVIMGMAEQLEEKQQIENAKGKLQQGLQLIQRNSRNLLRLINQLLDLSKLDSGKLKLHMVRGDLVAYLQYLTESFYSMAADKEIRLTCYSEEDALWMDYDEEKIQHIVYNLLSNAIKFTPRKGKVIFHIRKQEQAEMPWLELKIRDTGPGIAPDQLPHIFERFYQADDSSTRKGEGTGIGLALTKELIELMQGSIAVESTPGQGTTFLIRLPIAQNAGPAQTVRQPLAPDRRAGSVNHKTIPIAAEQETVPNEDVPSVLIMEDNPDVVLYIRNLLEQDYRIHTAENGQMGIDMAIELIPDIIISDVMMPEKDGFEVCATLKQDERTSHIPIILLTARAEPEDRLEGLQYGADAYLTKPFQKRELQIRLEKLVEIRQKLQARFSRGTATAVEVAEARRPDSERAFLEKLEAIVQQHLGETGFGVPQLAEALHMSQMQVYRKLKALTGRTPSQFIRSFRLQKGKELLHTTDLTISEIAYEVGFSDPNYFSRTFHHEFKVSPNVLRK
jgi:signal transduction histidine kinase/ligand-binding sensor domain-containing protein/CheY-like chemotaxis protein